MAVTATRCGQITIEIRLCIICEGYQRMLATQLTHQYILTQKRASKILSGFSLSSFQGELSFLLEKISNRAIGKDISQVLFP